MSFSFYIYFERRWYHYSEINCSESNSSLHQHNVMLIFSVKPAGEVTVPLVTGGNLSPIDPKVSAENVDLLIDKKKKIPTHFLILSFFPKMKPHDAPSHRRVYMKDLETLKVTKGTEIQVRQLLISDMFQSLPHIYGRIFFPVVLCWQACVVEFHNPGRFFLHTQTPEMIKMLQTISMELQKANKYHQQAVTYTPCADEVCAVQFSRDIVRKDVLGSLSICISTEGLTVLFFWGVFSTNL